MLATKLTEKLPDPLNTKEHCQLFLRKKNTKPAKRAKIITHQPKSIESPNVVDIKSFTIEHPETSHKLPKTIRRGKNVFQVVGAGENSSQYNKTK